MTHSKVLFEEAQKYIPGGVNSPVRAFRGVGGDPLFIKRGMGAYLEDVDGNKYIDYVASWGPLILGHAHPEVIQKVTASLAQGLSFGAPVEAEVVLAQKISACMPSMEMIRFVNSGTEATMSAIRLARGFTKRNKIVKFSACYHGHSDSLLVAAGSGALTFGVPSSAGVPDCIAQHTLVALFNALEEVAALFSQYGEEIAAVIVEPVACNMNLVLPKKDFLEGLRKLCDQYQSVLIFDEVITGFRLCAGGAQEYFHVKPDLTTLGKIIGGGLPVGAFGGRSDIMQLLAPLGPVYQAGTLSGNPIAMAAGLATLDLISMPRFYTNLTILTETLIQGLKARAEAANIPFYASSVSSIFGLFFTDALKIETEQEVKRCNISLFRQFFHGMLREGIYLAPSAYAVGFISAAHREFEIEKTLTTAEKVFAGLVL